MNDADQAHPPAVAVERRQNGPNRRRMPRPGGRRATDPPAEWLSITEYACRHSVSRHTVYKWLREGLLEHYAVETVVRIRNRPPSSGATP
jgi:excisionase family DNA binding protein